MVAAKFEKRRLVSEPMRIKRYHLALGSDPQSLQSEVSKLIAEGWQPYGHLVIEEPPEKNEERLVQPMVQYEGDLRA
jgi:hypothetical protein